MNGRKRNRLGEFFWSGTVRIDLRNLRDFYAPLA
jgi:hypothetical protein